MFGINIAVLKMNDKRHVSLLVTTLCIIFHSMIEVWATTIFARLLKSKPIARLGTLDW
jgi:hypothetical protein